MRIDVIAQNDGGGHINDQFVGPTIRDGKLGVAKCQRIIARPAHPCTCEDAVAVDYGCQNAPLVVAIQHSLPQNRSGGRIDTCDEIDIGD